MLRCLGLVLLVSLLFPWLADPTSKKEAASRLLIAFASFRERPHHPKIYFYEHDGVASGKIAGSIEAVDMRSDYRPSLSHDGRYCAFASELENQTGRIQLWDRVDKKLIELPGINDSPNAQQNPALSGDGRWLAFAAWDRPGGSSRWDLFLYDISSRKMADLPGLNTPRFDERMPTLSRDGSWLAFVTNAGAGLTDVYLYHRPTHAVHSLPELNGPTTDFEPCLSADGQFVAFVSDRPGGSGGRDIYLFDRAGRRFLPLPGLNSSAQEQSPALSPSGRYLAFVSERRTGVGERDIFLYDRQTQRLLPTPGLNSKQEDFDPSVIELPAKR